MAVQGPSVKAQGGEEGAPGNSDMGEKGGEKRRCSFRLREEQDTLKI